MFTDLEDDGLLSRLVGILSIALTSSEIENLKPAVPYDLRDEERFEYLYGRYCVQCTVACPFEVGVFAIDRTFAEDPQSSVG